MATYEGIIDIVNRISEAGDTRISEAGDTRVAEQWNPESVAVSDSVSCQKFFEGVIAESVAVNDSINCQKILEGVIAESIDINDTLLTAWIAEGILSESGTSNDIILSAWIAEGILSESLISDDSILGGFLIQCILTESLISDDSILGETSIQCILTESVDVADIMSVRLTSAYAHLTSEGNETFAVGDILRIKTGEPGVLGDDEWLEVANIAHAPMYHVIRDKGGDYAANSNPAWTKGAAVVNYGQSGDGGVYMTASESNAPYMSIFTHAGSPWNTITTHVRMGNLNGYAGYGSDIYGWAAYIDSNNYIKIDPTNGIRMSGNIIITGGSMPGLTLDDLVDGSSYGRVQLSILDSGYLYLLRKSADSTEQLLVTAGGIEAYVNNIKNFELASGIAYLGDQANEHIKLSSSGLQIKDGATLYATYGATIYLGLTAAEHIKISSSGVQLYDGALRYASYGPTTWLGLTTNEHIKLTNSYLQFKNGATVLTSISGGNILVGQIGAGQSNVYITSGAIQLRNDTTAKITLASDGNISLAGGITMSSTGNIKGGQTDYATGTGFFLGYSGAAYKFSFGDVTNYIKWDGVNLLLSDGIIVRNNLELFAAGDLLEVYSDAQVSSGGSTIPVKVKEIYIARKGTLKIKFSITGTVGQSHARIYRNGTPVGILRHGTAAWVEYSQNIAGWSPGDYVRIYAWHDISGFNTNIRNFRLYSDNPLVSIVLL